MPASHLVIVGKVQGVFYRASAQKVARSLGLTGWIKNTEDGHVEAIVNGPEDAIVEFVDWCRQGPPGADVTDVTSERTAEIAFKDFKIVE